VRFTALRGAAAATIALRIAPRAPGARLTVALDGRPLAPRALEAGWHELRLDAPVGARAGETTVELTVDGGAEVDHLLLLPR
jgi:hypothetical protein